MLHLTEKRFADFFRDSPETGMGYVVATAILKDGRAFPQTVIAGGIVSRVWHHSVIPFTEQEIDRFEITHDKWNWE